MSKGLHFKAKCYDEAASPNYALLATVHTNSCSRDKEYEGKLCALFMWLKVSFTKTHSLMWGPDTLWW